MSYDESERQITEELYWLDFLPYPTIFQNIEGKWLKINDLAQSILKVKQSDPMDLQVITKMNNHLTPLFEKMEDLLKQVKEDKIETPVSFQTIPIFHGELVCTPCYKNNQLVGYLFTIKDLTKQVQEAEGWKQTIKLLQSIIDNSPSLVVIVDKSKKIISMNPAFQHVFSIGDSALGAELSSLKIFHSTELNEYIEKGLKGEITRGEEETITLPNGDSYSASVTVSPVEYKDHEYYGVGIIMHDITIKKAFENELKETEHLLRDSKQLAMIGQLAAGVAHEIRNPLTTLKGFIQILKEDRSNVPYIDVILNELNRLELITNEFLALAKPHAVHFQLCSLRELLNSSASFIQIECTKQNVTLELNVRDNIQVECDAHQIKQVLLNLMKNALDAMPNGGNLSLSLTKNNDTAEIAIIDTGYGISPERIKHLGEPFYSTKEKGTGLGLMVCQKIIKEHHGHIKFESKEGVGTKAVVSLPYKINE